MSRRDVAPRILGALRAGEMTSVELSTRLRASHRGVTDVLHTLEATGAIWCVQPRIGNQASVWALVQQRECHAVYADPSGSIPRSL